MNRVLCATTSHPARHKNLLRNLRYKLFGGADALAEVDEEHFSSETGPSSNPYYLLAQANS